MILLRGIEFGPEIDGLLLVILIAVLVIVGIAALCALCVMVAALFRILYVLITQGPDGVKRMAGEARASMRKH